MAMGPDRAVVPDYWSLDAADAARRLGCDLNGLSSAQAAERLARFGPNALRESGSSSWLRVLWNQLRSPLLLLLVFAAGASAATGEWVDATIVLAIVVATVGIGFWREYRAELAAAALATRIEVRASAWRDAALASVPLRQIVPGDVVHLSAGSLVPGDALLLEATDFFVNEAVLTGESFPVEKKPGRVSAGTPLARRTNSTFLGTNVRSGTARCLVVRTGRDTSFGALADRLRLAPPETEFDRGIRHFGYLLTTVMLVMVLAVFAANVVLGRPALETLLFSIALAVGLSPELLPAILSVNLSRGAQMMARHGVLVRHLNAIENLGSMDVLCTDKTGTLTEGVVSLEGAYDDQGRASARVLELGVRNAALQAGLANPLDQALLEAHAPQVAGLDKLGEVPYDFVRKRLSVVTGERGLATLITKGAFLPILEACDHLADGQPLDDEAKAGLRSRFDDWSSQGVRVLAVGSRVLSAGEPRDKSAERGLAFDGFLAFRDRPKPGAAQAVADLAGQGVAVKMITGDARLVAQHVARAIGLRSERLLTGGQLDELHDDALWRAADDTDIFAEVDPNQKERIILALKKSGHVVGFMGDGVNDAPAMHAADTSLSVDAAADVARQAADFVLLERDLEVIRRGIEQGRQTFANTLKYILTTTSANLGNMASMAVASLLLPFLPLLAGQVLLNNFLSDVPAVGIAGDGVDQELVAAPRRWNMRMIGRFMVEFGALSSLFDLATFGLLLYMFLAPAALFRTAWFVESLLTELAVALVVRTRRPFYRSRPGTLLWTTSLAVAAVAIAVPYLPGAALLGFVPPPATLLAAVIAITVAYVLVTDVLKRRFFGRFA
jgi:Mg2+-importing ATPase